MPDAINDIRQKKVRELIRDDFDGKQVAFADKIGRPDNYISRIVSSGRNRKGIGERVARHIERQCGKPKGWLDGDAKAISASGRIAEPLAMYGAPITAEQADLGREWGKLHEPYRSAVRTMIESAVAEQIKQTRGHPLRKSGGRKRDDDRPEPS